MLKDHDPNQNLRSWLIGQHRVIGYWINEALGQGEAALVERLLSHRNWLQERILELSPNAKAPSPDNQHYSASSL